ncbi:hypothetical protein [Streptomyces europaeiscabiei]|uniref:hypothetical protein n=1 Tax=Streptomyces europaeiscabiei TaxID=146819 RepID=UPI002E2B6131|nr:hypothetical protein [Streptomyces europaeiscabiei]
MLVSREVDEESIDHEVGIGGDPRTGERGAGCAVPGPGAGTQGDQRAVRGLVELGYDVGHQVAVQELEKTVEGEEAGDLACGEVQRGVFEAD